MAVDGTILVVDDDDGVRNLLQRLLGDQGHVVVTAQDGQDAVRRLQDACPDLLLLDVQMPGVDGLTLCRQLRETAATRHLPIVLMTAGAEGENLWQESGADAVVRKPFNRRELLAWARCLVRAKRAEEDLARAEATLVSLAAAIEARSLHDEDHPRRVAEVSIRLAAAAGLAAPVVAVIWTAALLHDVGTITVPDRVLRKSGPLTLEELAHLQQHPVVGADLCRSLRRGRDISAIVRGHHERWDGKGYPDGLAGEAIPLGARVVAVADAFDALTRPRPHRTAMALDEALEVLWAGAETQWDPRLVEVLERVSGPALATSGRR